MKELKEMLSNVGLDVTIMIAGLIGALVMISKKSAFSIKTTTAGILTGMVSANYLTELVVSVFNLGVSAKYGIAFLLGYGGLKFVEKIMNQIHKTIKGNDTPN